jgi:hypothetical protein
MDKKVIYNGASMKASWARRIEQSQARTYYTDEGITYPRIRYGDDDPRWGESPCSYCLVARGQFHVTAECEYEKCPKCGLSMGGHTCVFDEFSDQPPDSAKERQRARIDLYVKWAVFLGAMLLFAIFMHQLGVF